MSQLFACRGIQVVQELDLARVDERLTVKTQLLDVCGFMQETRFVVGIGINGVERLNAGRACRLQNRAAGKQQFSPFRRALSTQVTHIIFRTQCNTDQALGGVGNFYRAGNA